MFHTLFIGKQKPTWRIFAFFRKPRCLFRQLKAYFSNTARFWANSSRLFPHRFLFFRLAKCGTSIFFSSACHFSSFIASSCSAGVPRSHLWRLLRGCSDELCVNCGKVSRMSDHHHYVPQSGSPPRCCISACVHTECACCAE